MSEIKKKFLIISGEPDSGKTTTIFHLCKWLLGLEEEREDEKRKGFVIDKKYFEGIEIEKVKDDKDIWDFCYVLRQKDSGKKVLINSSTDNKGGIKEFKENFDDCCNNIDDGDEITVITSCRHILEGENKKLRGYLCSELNFYENNDLIYSYGDGDVVFEFPLISIKSFKKKERKDAVINWYKENTLKIIKKLLEGDPFNL